MFFDNNSVGFCATKKDSEIPSFQSTTEKRLAVIVSLLFGVEGFDRSCSRLFLLGVRFCGSIQQSFRKVWELLFCV